MASRLNSAIQRGLLSLAIFICSSVPVFSDEQLLEVWFQNVNIESTLKSMQEELGLESLISQPVSLGELGYPVYWLYLSDLDPSYFESHPSVMKVQPPSQNLKRDQKNLKAIFVSESQIAMHPDFRRLIMNIASAIPIFVAQDSTGQHLSVPGRVYVLDIPDPQVEWEVSQLPFVLGVHDYWSWSGGGSALDAWDSWKMRWLVRLMSKDLKASFVADLLASGVLPADIDGGCRPGRCPWYSEDSAFLEVNLTRAEAQQMIAAPQVLSVFAKTPLPHLFAEFQEFASLTENENFQRAVGGANAIAQFANPAYRNESPPRYLGNHFGTGLKISIFDWDAFTTGSRSAMTIPSGADPFNFSQAFGPHAFYRNAFYFGQVPYAANQNSQSSQIIHGARVSGVVANSTLPYLSDQTGVAPGATTLMSSVYFAGSDVAYRTLVTNLMQNQQVALQNRSFGTPNPAQAGYATLAAFIDQIVFDFDFNIVQSYGNNNNTVPNGEALAKNILSVGGIRKGPSTGTPLLSKSDDMIHSGLGAPSFGPTLDLRTKPDLVHYSDGLSTGNAVVPNPGSYLSTMQYLTSNVIYAISTPTPLTGTSASAAAVTGYTGLLMEMWKNRAFGNSATSSNVFLARPKSATLRALMINLADSFDLPDEMNRSTHAEIPRDRQGWGMPDLTGVNLSRGIFLISNEDRVLTSTTNIQRHSFCMDGTKDLRATLVYTDAPGTIAYNTASPVRVIDLDLEITNASRGRYVGNYQLNNSRYSPEASAEVQSDSRNTVENIFVLRPTRGKYEAKVSIRGGSLPVDGIPETPAHLPWDMTYSLVISGATKCTLTTSEPDPRNDPRTDPRLRAIKNQDRLKEFD